MKTRLMIPAIFPALAGCVADEDPGTDKQEPVEVCGVDVYVGVGGRPCGGCYPACPEGYDCHMGFVSSFCDWSWGDTGICVESVRDYCNPYGGDGCYDADTTCLQEQVGNCTDLEGLCVTAEERANILSGPVADNFWH